MKTEAKIYSRVSLLQVVNHSQTPIDNGVLRIIYKSDLNNHRFAQHGNKKVEDTANWDQAWFAQYE